MGADVDRLREAAALIRERAEAATQGRWFEHRDDQGAVWYGDEAAINRPAGTPVPVRSQEEWDTLFTTTGSLCELATDEDAAHVAGADPMFTLAVADMLEREADIRETQPRGFYEVREADTIAAAYLRL